MRFLRWALFSLVMLLVLGTAWATDSPAASGILPGQFSIRQMFIDGGAIGYIIVAISLAMVALTIEQAMILRRENLMPKGLADDVHRMITQGQSQAAVEACRGRPSFLGYVLGAGLAEMGSGYSAIEKAMEDAATQQAARLMRRIEYFAVISNVAPMLGLMGTVWGMILAFMEFEKKANPTVSELAPGVYKALVTTLFGLIVAVPAVSIFAILRNRVDELVAQATLLAEHVFADYKRAMMQRRNDQQRRSSEGTP